MRRPSLGRTNNSHNVCNRRGNSSRYETYSWKIPKKEICLEERTDGTEAPNATKYAFICSVAFGTLLLYYQPTHMGVNLSKLSAVATCTVSIHRSKKNASRRSHTEKSRGNLQNGSESKIRRWVHHLYPLVVGVLLRFSLNDETNEMVKEQNESKPEKQHTKFTSFQRTLLQPNVLREEQLKREPDLVYGGTW